MRFERSRILGRFSNEKEILGKKEILDVISGVWKEEFREANIPFKSARLKIHHPSILSYFFSSKTIEAKPEYDPEQRTIHSPPDVVSSLRRKRNWDETPDKKQQNAGRFIFLAHEFGHHIQELLSTFTSIRTDDRYLEYYADFLAGYCLKKALERKKIRIDINDVLATLQIVRLTGGITEKDRLLLGNALDRVQAFKEGFRSDKFIAPTMKQ